MWEEQTTSAPALSQKKSFDKKILVYGLVGLVIIVLVGISGYFFLQYQNAQKLLNGQASSQQTAELINKVGKLIDLPSNEKPQLATVTNKFKVNNQPFFTKAENGDQVLIYPKNKIAVLYRPGSNKVINYATDITVGQNNAAGTVSGAGTQATGTPAPSAAVSPTAEPTPTSAPIPTKAPTSAPTGVPTPTP